MKLRLISSAVAFAVSVFLAPAFDAYSNAVTEIATGDSKFD